jgi:hypothetical protein
MASLEFTGVIVWISAVETGVKNDKQWEKFTIKVEEIDGGQYPNYLCATAFNKPEVLKPIAVGDKVKVLYNMKAPIVGDKCFQNNDIFVVKVIEKAQAQSTYVAPAAPADPADDVPF